MARDRKTEEQQVEDVESITVPVDPVDQEQLRRKAEAEKARLEAVKRNRTEEFQPIRLSGS